MIRPLKLSLIIAICMLAVNSNADLAGEKKKTQLAEMKRLAVAPIFFSSSTLFKFEDLKQSHQSDKSDKKKPDIVMEKYRDQLRNLEEDAKKCLPERSSARTPYIIVTGDQIDAALMTLKLTPMELFLNGGRMKGGKFPLPDPAAVRKFCAFLHVDGVILGTMDEPRRTNGQYFLDPGGLNYDSAHVETKSGMFLMKADGAEILHDYIETLHPLTKRRDKDFVLVDWRESTELMIEDFLDEVCRYSPAK